MQVDQRYLMCQCILLGVWCETLRGEQGIPVVVAAQGKVVISIFSVVLVDIAEHAEGIADDGDVDFLAHELRLGKEAKWERERRGDKQLAEPVDLMIGTPSSHQEKVSAGS